MRNPQKLPAVPQVSGAGTIRQSAIDRDFERAACQFFREYNGHPPTMSLSDFLACFERAVVMEALTEMNGCQRRAAAFLKLKNTTLNHKIRAQHIQFVKTPV